ncbi:vitamin B12-dependent ribonucleotide reductase [Candidatus Woesearchaeota archaeon]|nr:vitamin B12-dependent ribonucleotide reductase [Candidatus Woesearchaeota archaeon]
MTAGVIEYIPNKHVRLEELAQLNVPSEALNGLTPYSLNGTKFYDRLELGRAVHTYHQLLNGKPSLNGIKVERYFTDGKTDPFETAGKYEQRPVKIEDEKTGKIVFEMVDAEFPETWGKVAAQVAASKYFYKPNKNEWKAGIEKVYGKPYEYSPRHLFGRVSKFFAERGFQLGYFVTEEDKKAFEDELNFLQINQMFAFNSPVNFNAGLFDAYGIKGSPGINFIRDYKTGEVRRINDGCYNYPQSHACFIKGPSDDLETILNQVPLEGAVFTNGSGIGQELSVLRARGEPLSSGGKSSGPMSFFKVWDVNAGSIQSGGKTRRAARMTTMRYTHPDIMEFIKAKPREDYIAVLLMKAGLEPGFEGEAYQHAFFQNTNLSVRALDHLFEQEEKDGFIETRYVKSGEIAERINAREMLKWIAFGSWRSGDPAIQYESRIQEWHTCKNSGEQNSTNPCSEYLFLDNTACNLGSLNFLKFLKPNGEFDIESYERAIKITTIALDIANHASSYPDKDIAKISPEFGTIGLGYANLGALLMSQGLPYDSDKGRALATALTAILNSAAYRTSTELAEHLGTFVHYEFNREPMLEVIKKHKSALNNINWELVDPRLRERAYSLWDETESRGEVYGFRNAQATVIAPTGTIALLMDCDTTGAEPFLGLKSVKNLAGGGNLRFNTTNVQISGLRRLGYNGNQINDITKHIDKFGIVVGTPHLSPGHYAVFDTSYTPVPNGRTISFKGHIKMVGAIQPFISGAISKTNNLPSTATVKDVYDGYIFGWKQGLKALSIFRDQSKPVSVLTLGNNAMSFRELKRGEKRELPYRRHAEHLEVEIGGMKFHIRPSEYPDGTVGDLFIDCADLGSTSRGLAAMLSITFSSALKTGTNLEYLVKKYSGHEYPPNGMVTVIDDKDGKRKTHPYIPLAKSITDFVARWLAVEYLGDLTYVQEDLRPNINIHELRGVKNGAIRTYRRQKINEWDFEQVMKDPELGGFVEVSGDPIERLIINPKSNGNNVSESYAIVLDESELDIKRLSGSTCKNCGNLLHQTKANCYSCSKCGSEFGGCG